MQLPLGILIYWTARYDTEDAVISALWYYKEVYIPSLVEEKKQSIVDLKNRRCTVVNIHARPDQIVDILLQGDQFKTESQQDITHFLNKINNTPDNEACIFDDVQNLKGTAIGVDTIVEVDETMEDITKQIKSGKPVTVNISKDWSFNNDLLKAFANF